MSMDYGPEVTVGSLIETARELAMMDLVRVVAAMAIMTAVGVVSDHVAVSTEMALVVTLFFQLIQFWIMVGLLARLDLRREGAGGFLRFFVVGLISTVAILIGFILFVIPGLVLLARWAMALPVALAEDANPAEALGISWQDTGPGFWPVLGLLLVVYMGSLGLTFVAASIELSVDYWLGLTLVNLAINVGLVAGWYVSLALYATLRGTRRVAELFT